MKLPPIAAAGAALALFVGAAKATPLDNGVYRPGADAPTLIQARARTHTCVARSRTAVGYWTARSLATAKHGALVQCAIRTPRGVLCVIVSCS